MKRKKRGMELQSLLLVGAMLCAMLSIWPGSAAFAAYDGGWWNAESGFSLDFNGELSQLYHSEDPTDTEYPIVHSDTITESFFALAEAEASGTHGKSLQFTKENYRANILFNRGNEVETASGIYKLKFSFLANQKPFSVMLGASEALNEGVLAARITGSGTLSVCGASLGYISPKQWIDIEEIFDLRDGVNMVYYTVSQNNAVKFKGNLLLEKYADANTAFTGLRLRQLSMYVVAASTTTHNDVSLYFDDLSLVPINEDLELFHYDFEDAQTEASYVEKTYGYSANGEATLSALGQEDGGHHQALKLTGNGNGAAAIAMTLDKEIAMGGKFSGFSKGCVRFTCSLLPGEGLPVLIQAGESGPYLSLGFVSDDEARYAPTNQHDSTFCRIDPQKWVDLDTLVDFNNRTITYSVSQDGKEVGFAVRPLTDSTNAAWSETGKITRIRPCINANTEGSIYFDDLRAYLAVPSPKLTDARVSFTDALGNQVSGTEANLTVHPALEKITLNFGAPITEAVENGITLTESDGGPLAINVDADSNGVCTVSLTDGYLKGNTSYTLKVSGEGMEEYALAFATQAAETMFTIQEVTDQEGNPLREISQIQKGPFSAKLCGINMENTEKKLMLAAAYYKENVLLDVSADLFTVAPNSSLSSDAALRSIPASSKAAEADSFRIYLWDSATLCPCQEPISLPAEAQDPDMARVAFEKEPDMYNATVTDGL